VVSLTSNGTINVDTESEDANSDGEASSSPDQYSLPGSGTMLKKSQRSKYIAKMAAQPKLHPHSDSNDSTQKEQNYLFSQAEE